MALEELQNGRYRRLRLLGTGGMGEVYLMQDTRVSRQVAIKIIRSEGDPYPGSDAAKGAARLFQREARAIAALEHPNILPLYDFGEETIEGTTMTYMVMPFVTDGSLAGWLRQRASAATLSPQDIAYVVEQAAEALQYAHDHQLIHLDVKPSNFLLRSNRKNPNRPTLLLADFGIARNSATAASSSRTIRGTPTTMAPEQWSSSPVAASDQYALAVMAYELLAGRPPFVGSMEQLMYQHFSVQPAAPSTYNPELPAAIDAVLLRALAKKPEDRFPSITAFASALEEAVHEAPAELVVGPRPSRDGDITRDMRTTLAISQAEAHTGTSRKITLPGGQHVNVTIPAGVSHGQVIRVPDLGDSSSTVNELILTIAIKQPEEARLSSHALSAEATVLTPPSSAQQPSDPVLVDDLLTVPVSDSNLQTPQEQRLPFDPSSDHNLPTVASSAPNLKVAEKQQQPPLPKRRPAPRSRIVAIISGLIVLLVLVILASTVYLYNNHQASVNAIAHSQTATAVVRPTQAPTHAPTVASTPTAKPQNGLYIAGTYNGSMVNEITQETTTVSVFLGQSKGNAALSGTFVFRSPSKGSYPLTGTVDTQGNFSFTVQQSAGQTPLVFYGTFQQDFLRGNFCSSSTNSCSAGTGYFSAGPRS
jgi:serine/threonine protein kinase